jgi:V/A-type H+-transporting ATPase subunit A
LAEYYRDLGYDVVVMIDSISRWAEAEEGGYPHGARLTRCYERAGRVEVLGGGDLTPATLPSATLPSAALPLDPNDPKQNHPFRCGSKTLIRSISPEGGNFSDPVTQALARSSGAFWALDRGLAQARRFPAIDWNRSHSFYESSLDKSFAREAGEDWPDLKEYLRTVMERREELSGVLRRENHTSLSESPLSEEDRWLLYHAETLEIVYLRQNAQGETRSLSSSSLARMASILRLLKTLDGEVRKVLKKDPDSGKGVACDTVTALPLRSDMIALRGLPEKDFKEAGREWLARFTSKFAPSVPAEEPRP